MKLLLSTLMTLTCLSSLASDSLRSVDAKNPLLVACRDSNGTSFLFIGSYLSYEGGNLLLVSEDSSNPRVSINIDPAHKCTIESNYRQTGTPSMGISN